MSDSMPPSMQPIDVHMDDYLLKKTFLEHLNYIYYGKQHLIAFFEEVKGIATLTVLKHAIQEGIDDTASQIQQMDEVYAAIKEKPEKTNTLGIKALTLEAYLSAIKAGKTALEKDVFILFYLQQIEGIEITYFKVLKNLAKAIGYSNSFIDQPFDIAVENKLLFESIYKEYIS
ncbi:ferritin-like domain-containing protein [Mucilaginibacter sp. BJC16-A38]|uniref:ferritin-like domain-containing protein n=1 Tax=Mucilaginibacter phenanthrenivorans TaxID=1234842 RepID=UPI002157A3FE|nr:ferritin-like domain-containing protein [Mucilaginibacter phenanthrenivorans]MCR8558658.1 ferritin-like domain-containing protein [Mucilaginibacter phenanthrenivorans]